MNRAETRHKEALEDLLQCPRKVGIFEPVLWSAKEVFVYKPGTLELSTEIDLMYKTVKRFVIAEYKGYTGHRATAREQLDKAYWFVRRNFGEKPECYYIHGASYQVERIR